MVKKETFGQRLRRWRQRIKPEDADSKESDPKEADPKESDSKGITPDELVTKLSEKFGIKVSRSTVYKWEQDKRRPKREHVEALLNLFAQHGVLSLLEARAWLEDGTYEFSERELENIFPFESFDTVKIDYPYPEVVPDVSLRSKQYYCRETNIAFYLRAIQEAKTKSNQPKTVELAIVLAKIYQQHSNFHQAMATYEQILPLAEQLDDKGYLMARVKNNLAYLYGEVDAYRYQIGQRYCQEAIKIFNSLRGGHDRDPSAEDCLAHAYNHLGLLEMRFGNNRRHGLDHLEKARKLWEDKNEDWWINSLINLGVYHLELNDYKNALDTLEKAKRNAKKAKNKKPMTVGSICLNQAVIFQRLGKLGQARAELEDAAEIFKAYDYLSGLAKVHYNLGQTLFRQEDWAESRYHLDYAHKLWQHLKIPYWTEQAEKALEDWEEATDKYIIRLASHKED